MSKAITLFAIRNVSSVRKTALSPDTPLRDVLEKCRPFDSTEEKNVFMNVLNKSFVKSAKNWLELSKASKIKLESNGLPENVINDLNSAVHSGLLLPEFKYADKVNFLETENHLDHKEAHTVWGHAAAVDSIWSMWNLNRTDCNALCENYQEMVELTQKYFLKRYSNVFHKGKKAHNVDMDMSPNAGSLYPATHHLDKLQYIIRIECPSLAPPLCNSVSLKTITKCGEESKYMGEYITCNAFYSIVTNDVDPYLFHLWNTIQTVQLTRKNFNAYIVRHKKDLVVSV